MSLTGKIIIALLIAGAASTLLGFYKLEGMLLFAAFSAATIATALLTSIKIDMSSATAPAAKSSKTPAKTKPSAKKAAKPSTASSAVSSSAKREEGEVKWFNVTKGFGFISRENGEEIFVHFRSIRGEGRRSLRDGQRVTFVVTDSDKGPQAEDVEGLA
ncbi:MAG: CspA family cold shock protein [Halioglobus sp.]|jgi:CspA family cold shock protein